jgi:ABC-2 type transport system permease protein
MPLSFLAGTFYSIKILPGYWELIAYANPIFYVVDGMRYGLLDYHEASLLQGLIVLIGLNTILLTISYRLLKRGYKLKS